MSKSTDISRQPARGKRKEPSTKDNNISEQSIDSTKKPKLKGKRRSKKPNLAPKKNKTKIEEFNLLTQFLEATNNQTNESKKRSKSEKELSLEFDPKDAPLKKRDLKKDRRFEFDLNNSDTLSGKQNSIETKLEKIAQTPEFDKIKAKVRDHLPSNQPETPSEANEPKTNIAKSPNNPALNNVQEAKDTPSKALPIEDMLEKEKRENEERAIGNYYDKQLDKAQKERPGFRATLGFNTEASTTAPDGNKDLPHNLQPDNNSPEPAHKRHKTTNPSHPKTPSDTPVNISNNKNLSKDIGRRK